MPCTYCGNDCGGCCKSCGEPQESRTGCDCEPKIVIDSKGSCYPIIRDEDTTPPEPYKGGVIIHNCRPAQCGDKTIGAPQYELVIENPPDDIRRNPDGSPVLVNGAVVLNT